MTTRLDLDSTQLDPAIARHPPTTSPDRHRGIGIAVVAFVLLLIVSGVGLALAQDRSTTGPRAGMMGDAACLMGSGMMRSGMMGSGAGMMGYGAGMMGSGMVGSGAGMMRSLTGEQLEQMQAMHAQMVARGLCSGSGMAPLASQRP